MASFGSDNEEGVYLNLMPMLDIFSIIITFLLMTFSAEPVIYDSDGSVELPKSQTVVSLSALPSIKVTTTELWVEDRKVSDIVAGDLPPENIDQGAARPVFDELKKMREARMQRELNRGVARERQDLQPKPGVVIMEMDKSHNFKLMRRIMLAAQQAEYVTFKLMVTKPTE